jgi:hypothetical protein
MTSSPAARVAQTVRTTRPVRILVRAGYAVSGLLHALIGAIAIQLAVGTDSQEADQSGALQELASTPGGVFVLWVVVVGFVALGLWLLVTAFLPVAGDRKRRVVNFLTDFVKAIVYLVLAFTAFTFARGGATSSAGSTSTMSADVLAAPGGMFVVVVTGVVVFAVGVYLIVKGVTRRFKKDLGLPSGALGTTTVVLGVLGYVAKGVALGTVGVLFVIAALTSDAAKANGLDAALRTLAGLPFGAVVLIVVGGGLIAYALYSFLRARYARM